MACNTWETRTEKVPAQGPSWFSKISPLRSLSDKEYEDMLLEKILRIDAEIALIDESIAALRAAPKQATPSVNSDSQGKQ